MIKADGPANVKLRLKLWLVAVIGAVGLAASSPLLAQSEKDAQNLEAQEFGIESGTQPNPQAEQERPEGVPEDYQTGSEPERVKPIEAEEFRVKASKKSRSGRVVMLEDITENRPRPGKILLLKNGNEDMAAVRVLKNYPGKFAAKIVLPIGEIQTGTDYRALKKLGDKIIHMIKEREKRGKDLDAAKTDEDLANEVSPDDNELDRGIPLPKVKGGRNKLPDAPSAPLTPGPKAPEPLFTKDGQELSADSIEVTDDEDAYIDMSIQEEAPLDPYRHVLSLEYGSIRSVDKNSEPTTYGAIGVRYAFNAWRPALFRRKSFQDMVSFELGLFYYTITGFMRTDDSVTVYPLIGTARYSFLIGENLTFFGYLGMIRNNVSQGQDSVSSNTAVLATSKAAMGVGAMLKIGPAWAARLDVGNDMFGIGAVLKF